jgi:hypothetical protein
MPAACLKERRNRKAAYEAPWRAGGGTKLDAVKIDRRAHSKMVAAEHANKDDIGAERPIEPSS